jgi:RNA polymerase-binding transcription factor DksA
MEESLIVQLKGKLFKEKGKIISQLEEMTQEKTFNKDKVQVKWKEMGTKEEDSAMEVANFQDSISLERNLEESLEKIEKALEKIEKGEYGKCEKCPRDIEEERLIAYPEATICLECTVQKRP